MIAECFCFTVFESRLPERCGGPALRAAKERPLAASLTVAEEGRVSTPDERGISDPAGSDQDQQDAPVRWTRFVQFGFSYDYFLVDLPDTVLRKAEADEILHQREGFVFARDRENPDASTRDILDFDPLQKLYRYGEEEAAAEDAAFIFFEVWGLPVDSLLYASSASGEGRPVWEREEPFE